jgi:hypothetical protein
VSGQQLAASSEEESSGSAIVPGLESEIDLSADWSERCRALQQAWPFIAISDWLEFAFVDLVSGAAARVRMAIP